MNWIDLATKHKRFRIKRRNSEINIKLVEEMKEKRTTRSSGVHMRPLDDSNVCDGHRATKKIEAHRAKTTDWKPWDCVCQSVGRCIVCVVRFYLLFASFSACWSPKQKRNVAQKKKQKARTTPKLELKTNAEKNVLFDATDSVHKLCENFVIYWSFEVKIERKTYIPIRFEIECGSHQFGKMDEDEKNK